MAACRGFTKAVFKKMEHGSHRVGADHARDCSSFDMRHRWRACRSIGHAFEQNVKDNVGIKQDCQRYFLFNRLQYLCLSSIVECCVATPSSKRVMGGRSRISCSTPVFPDDPVMISSDSIAAKKSSYNTRHRFSRLFGVRFCLLDERGIKAEGQFGFHIYPLTYRYNFNVRHASFQFCWKAHVESRDGMPSTNTLKQVGKQHVVKSFNKIPFPAQASKS